MALPASEVAHVKTRMLDGLTPEEEKFIVDLAGQFDTAMLGLAAHHGGHYKSHFGTMSAIELSLAVIKMFGETLPDVIAAHQP